MNAKNKKMIFVLKIALGTLLLLFVCSSFVLHSLTKQEGIQTFKSEFEEADGHGVENGAASEGVAGVSTDMDLSHVAWATYRSDIYGLSFSYPADFAVKIDEVKYKYENGNEWHYIFFESGARKQKARFSMEINPDGTGPFFIDKEYILERDAQGRVLISSIIDRADEDARGDGVVWRYAQINYGGNNFVLHFLYDTNGETDRVDYDALFADILESMSIE